MELITLEADIHVMYITAKKFPEDIPSTYTQLEQTISIKTERRYFGYSQPNNGGVIVYRACAEVLNANEPIEYNFKTMIIKAGDYASIYIKNHFDDENNIPNAFSKLLKHPQLDPNGFCLEIYKNFTDPDVNCLVPIVSNLKTIANRK